MYCRTMLQFLHSKRTLFPFSLVLIWVLFPCNRMLKDNVSFVRFYSMRVLFPFSASASTGTVPVHYSPRVLSPFIRIMQDKVPFLHSKRVGTVPIFHQYCSCVPCFYSSRVLFPFIRMLQDNVAFHHSYTKKCSNSPKVLIQVL